MEGLQQGSEYFLKLKSGYSFTGIYDGIKEHYDISFHNFTKISDEKIKKGICGRFKNYITGEKTHSVPVKVLEKAEIELV